MDNLCYAQIAKNIVFPERSLLLHVAPKYLNNLLTCQTVRRFTYDMTFINLKIVTHHNFFYSKTKLYESGVLIILDHTIFYELINVFKKKKFNINKRNFLHQFFKLVSRISSFLYFLRS